MLRLLGTQYQNAAFLAVPPSSGAFSSRITSSPSQREKSAAGRPPPPPPTTTTSVATSKAPLDAGAAASRSSMCLSPLLHRRHHTQHALHHPAELRHRVIDDRRAAPGHVHVGTDQHAARLLDLAQAHPVVVDVARVAS